MSTYTGDAEDFNPNHFVYAEIGKIEGDITKARHELSLPMSPHYLLSRAQELMADWAPRLAGLQLQHGMATGIISDFTTEGEEDEQ